MSARLESIAGELQRRSCSVNRPYARKFKISRARSTHSVLVSSVPCRLRRLSLRVPAAYRFLCRRGAAACAGRSRGRDSPRSHFVAIPAQRERLFARRMVADRGGRGAWSDSHKDWHSTKRNGTNFIFTSLISLAGAGFLIADWLGKRAAKAGTNSTAAAAGLARRHLPDSSGRTWLCARTTSARAGKRSSAHSESDHAAGAA